MAFEADTAQDVLKKVFDVSLSALQVEVIGTASFSGEVDISGGGAIQGTTVVSAGIQPMLESADIDGAALPNPVTEGQGVRAKGSLYGIQLVKLVSEDGSSSVEDEINNAINVLEIAPSRDRTVTEEIQGATTLTAAETALGGEINVTLVNTMTIYIDLTIGNSAFYDIIPKFLRVSGGDEHPFNTWSSGAIKTVTAEKFRFTADGMHYITLDVTGLDIVKVYGDASNASPDGTVQVGYTLSNN